MSNNEIIRKYRQGDETGILKLYEEVYEEESNLEFWNWKFRECEQGPALIYVVENNKEIIACSSWIHSHLNFMGREIPAFQTVDMMVRSDHRGKSLYTKLRAPMHEEAAEKGIKAVFAFANRTALPRHIAKFDWVRILQLKRYEYRIGYREILGTSLDAVYKMLHKNCRMNEVKKTLRNIRARSLGRGCKVVVSSRTPDDLAECLEKAREKEVLAVNKDLSYLKWRYDKNPEYDYSFHVLYAGGIPKGFIVTRNCGREITICDFIHQTNDIIQSASLLAHVVNYYHLSKAQVIQFYGHDNVFFDWVFHGCGFKAFPASGMVFAGRVFDDINLQRHFLQPYNWSLSHGDSDLI